MRTILLFAGLIVGAFGYLGATLVYEAMLNTEPLHQSGKAEPPLRKEQDRVPTGQ